MRHAESAFALVGLALLLAACRQPDVAQPFPFNHQIHTQQEDMGCEECHAGVLVRADAGIPRVSVCMDCHDDDITSNPLAANWIDTVREAHRARADVPWVRLYELPHHVFFSHRRHASHANLACSTCHADQGERETPQPRAMQVALTMSGCMSCHESEGIDQDCNVCHR